ncbi:MAG TPA: hypothetical protein VKB61_10050 [Candidatus Acidoferrum sp.]|nr:hypothetical protein [Candidatus Acidoferrum sp.]
MTPKQKTEVLPGARALTVPKTLDVLGRRIEQMSGHLLTVNQGALHPHTAAIIARFFKAKAEDWT